jgi:hypothetical protein
VSQSSITPEDRYATLVEEFLGQPGVLQGGQGFGANGLKIRGKIFAMLVRGRLVVKLPRARVDALVADGDGARFDPRNDGRLMKEWIVLAPHTEDRWLPLAQEALAFVGAQS